MAQYFCGISLPTNDKITVETTLPVLEIQTWANPIITERLIIRPLRLKDIEGFSALRSQPEVTALAYEGGSDPEYDLNSNFEALINYLRPWMKANIYFAILSRTADGEEGEYIGELCLQFGNGWPSIGYMFRREYWGQGCATEAVKGFMKFYWDLPRGAATLVVHPATIHGPGGEEEKYTNTPPKVKERVLGEAERLNGSSQRVLLKAGFEQIERIFTGLDLFQYIFPLAQVDLEAYREMYWRGYKARPT
ncbi:GNAT domain-containing protein [Daldinia decipiens]|uniref:GNAT domain-containing protein n=1 Tax=Daldinia decipiens TaxID=326647 RepID=UPI0020C414ED|nr:GNAT domain-containing protein [Daldinia decipiens]KAI1662793.1 GNAT domain-containing protein [Daldinia decipiens]